MSMAWQEPVTDRAQADIDAKTPGSKAYLNAADINRIEGNIAYLSGVLNGRYYLNQTRSKTGWDKSGIPNKGDIRRICGNITAIRNAFRAPAGLSGVSGLPGKVLDYEDINLLEKNLLEIKKLLDWMAEGFRPAGSFTANTTLFLPKRRVS